MHAAGENRLKAGRWYHLVAAWDGQEKTIWIDGQEAERWPFQGIKGVVTPGASPLRLAAAGEVGLADHFLDGDLLDLLHAETQALWDLRRTIAWIRTQEPAAQIGVLGYSLGGYNAALLAAHEPGLDFVVAGIPVCDFASALWRHIPPAQRAYYVEQGLDQDRYRRLLHVVSPVALAPKLRAQHLYIFAGSADRVVPPDQPLRLAKHWGRPINWFPGAHLTFRGERAVVRCIEDAMVGAGWALRESSQPVEA